MASTSARPAGEGTSVTSVEGKGTFVASVAGKGPFVALVAGAPSLLGGFDGLPPEALCRLLDMFLSSPSSSSSETSSDSSSFPPINSGLRVLRTRRVLRPPALLFLCPSVVSCYSWFHRARPASTAFGLLAAVPKSPRLGVVNATCFVVPVPPCLLLPSLLSSPHVAPRVLQLHPLQRQSPVERKMATDALALVVAALVAASPGGVPGRQIPALLQAASVLAGRGAFSLSSRERHNQRRQSRAPVFCSPPRRTPACLRPRQQQSFRQTQWRSAQPLHSRVPPVASLPQPRPPQSPPPRAVTANLPTQSMTPPQPGRAPLVAATHKLSRRQRRQQSQQQSLLPPSPAQLSPPSPSTSTQPQRLPPS
ncbi:unnamed protein product [Closterium sp. NIES-65]|nr:unnamed protein product [Closterium sp. NIES-65]